MVEIVREGGLLIQTVYICTTDQVGVPRMSANRSGLPGTSAYRVYLYQYQVTGTLLVRSTAYLVGLACTRSNQQVLVLRSSHQYSYRKVLGVPGTGTGFAYLVLLPGRSTPGTEYSVVFRVPLPGTVLRIPYRTPSTFYAATLLSTPYSESECLYQALRVTPRTQYRVL